MLFPYTYVPHRMEKMQEFIDFIFFEVWCKAPIGLDFHPDLFDDAPDLKEVMSEFGFSSQAPVRGNSFYREVKSIYESFASLLPAQIDQLKQWYCANNEIERICANDPAISPARYPDIKGLNEALAEKLGSFYKRLYGNDLLGLAALRAKVGDVDGHYNEAFLSKNRTGKCPFCGISDIKGQDHSRREAYDHYLPKALYPFNSINFRNLAPTCHDCNSTYKLSRDPVSAAGKRRKAFYPYAAANHDIKVTVALRHSDIEKLTSADITLRFGPAALAEEIDTWISVYSIEERYKAKLCGSNDVKAWLNQLEEFRNYGLNATDSLALLGRQTEKYPYADCNFLKKAFLEGFRKPAIRKPGKPGP